MRAECQEVETGLSILRRVVQGRLDIVGLELTRRAEGGEPADLTDLIAQLPEVLADRTHAPGVGRLPQLLAPGELQPDLEAELDEMVGRRPPVRPARMDDDRAALASPTRSRASSTRSRATAGALRPHRRPPGRDHPPVQDRRGQRRRPAPVGPRARAGLTVARGRRVPCACDEGGLGAPLARPRRVHPRAAPGRPPLAAQAVGDGRDLEPVPQPDRAGLRKPSAEILQQIARALEISSETLYVRAGILEEREGTDLVAEIRRDPYLSEEQKKTLSGSTARSGTRTTRPVAAGEEDPAAAER